MLSVLLNICPRFVMVSFWAATFDEARVWSRPLTAAEVLKAMDGTILAVDSLEKLTATWGSIK